MQCLLQVWAFPSDSELADFIVNEPSWLLQDIVGTVLAPWNTGRERVAFEDGRAFLAQVEQVLDGNKRLPDGGKFIAKMLLLIGLLVKYGPSGDEVIVPSIMPYPVSLLGKLRNWFIAQDIYVHAGV